ncbi:hypothetical protein PAXRUDRAFT_825026 [Paxillus rubicundulus Ve08.2h10]|uniref:Uncharacterized protein n=1 Tax=Paxillus rubicundulus Ve08.2h10 TaxID=930991 RepID=A0A0D0E137_9AGAM|nr:hypothetical protein PAXRUDRAFT_825026 [Paxillus rubicundulus Ve08.2h10]
MEAECQSSDASRWSFLARPRAPCVDSISRAVCNMFFLAGRHERRCASVSGVSVLETLWIAAHSQTLYGQMADTVDTSLDNLRAAGMPQFVLQMSRLSAPHPATRSVKVTATPR